MDISEQEIDFPWVPAPNNDEFDADVVPFQPRFLFQELLIGHCPYLRQPCLTGNLLRRVDWLSLRGIAGCECVLLCRSWRLPPFQDAAAAGRAAQGSTPRVLDPAGTGGSKRTPMEPLRNPARQFSVRPKEQRTRRRRRAVLAAFPTSRTNLCPQPAPASLIHPRNLLNRADCLSQRNRRRRVRHLRQLLSAWRWQTEHPRRAPYSASDTCGTRGGGQ